MVKVQVSPRKSVYVKSEKERGGVFCTFFGDDSEEFPMGEKFISVPKSCSDASLNLIIVGATKDYFTR